MSTKDKDKNILFFRLYNAIQSRLYAFLLMMVHNETDAEDLMQETSAILWEKFDEFQEGSNFKAWAFAIAKNRACLFLRQHQKSRLLFMDELYQQIPSVAEQILDHQGERITAMKECIKKLSENDREILRMRYSHNNAPRTVSQLTGRSLNGLYKSLTRIHTLLRACIMRTLRQWELS